MRPEMRLLAILFLLPFNLSKHNGEKSQKKRGKGAICAFGKSPRVECGKGVYEKREKVFERGGSWGLGVSDITEKIQLWYGGSLD